MAVPVRPVAPSSAVPCRSSWCIASRSSRRGSCGSRWPCAARREQAARQDRTAGRKCVAALFRAGETGVSDPRLPAVMENAEGRRLHLLRFRTGPGKTGARDRYGHALTGWEAGSRHYAATAGSTWRRRRPRSWASGRPKAPAGRFAYIVFDGSATAIRLLVAAVLAGPVGARLRERADVVGRHRAVRSARPVGGRGRGAGRREIEAGAWSEVSRRRASALTPSFISRMRLHGRNRQRSSTRRRHVGRGARQERFGSPDRCRRAGFSRAWRPESAGGRSLEAENCQRCQRLRPA